MSIKPQKCLSPSKENMSPTRQASKGDPVTQLLGFIKAAGLKLPSHIEKCIHQDTGALLKIIPTEQSNPKQVQSLQKLKIKLGDTQFELKKIQQDFAQYKLNSRLEKQKQIKRWEEAYNHLKNTLEYSNQDSSIKILKLRQSAQKQLKNLKQKHQAQLKQQKQKLVKSYEQKISSMKKLNQREVRQLKQKTAQDIQALKQKYQTQIKQLKQSYQVEIRRINLKNKQVLDNKQKQFESIYTAIQSEKKTQEKLHQKTRIQASQTKQKLYSELYFQRNVKKGLEQTLQKRESQIKSLKSQIHSLQVDIVLQKQRYEKKQKQQKQQFQKSKIGCEQLHKQKIANILQSHIKQLKKYEQKVQEINQWKDSKQTLLMQRCDQIQNKFEDRPSRQQDLDTIQKLRNRLARKQQQLRVLNKQLKVCVMQSQNKEETYNKIFTSNTMNKFQKKCLSKDRQQFRSKDSLCRKSQTTDIKFLLKVYNKHV